MKMSSLKSFYWVLTISTLSISCLDFVQGASSPRWEPQISVLCEPGQGQIYHPQFLSEEGRWVTDLSIKTPVSTCLRDKIDLLDYCKKVYPNRDITNIVESSHYQKIGGWCRQGALHTSKCKGSHRWIKPFRCLEGPFQSDALLVPEGCLFDHIHNASRCWPFVRWNQTGAAACQERGMQMRSFAMLLPCGISLFSGVEFVCCPKHMKAFTASETLRFKKTDLPVVVPERPIIDEEDISEDSKDTDDEDDEDMLNDEEDIEETIKSAEDTEDNGEDEYDSNEDTSAGEQDSYDPNDSWDDITKSAVVTSTSTTTSTAANSGNIPDQSSVTTSKPTDGGIIISASASASSAPTNQPTVDPYFTHFDPRLEHQSYKVSQKRLEENHREKVTRVMKDWSDLEEKYQDMRMADPKAAQTFKQRMTARFQTSVQALEEEGNAEKHQLAAMHQQRVLAHINQRKREAMTCYTQALTEQPPNTHRVEKCLQKLLRALHKDRAHALAHYRHLLNSGGPGGLEAAASERPRTLERLIDIDRAVNQSMTMLKRYPEISSKIAQLMSDYILALRSKDDIPGTELGMSEEAEALILDKYRTEIERKVSEKERQRLAEKQRKEQRAAEREKLREEKLRMEAKKIEELVKEESQNNEDEEDLKKEQYSDINSPTTMESIQTDKYVAKELVTETSSSLKTQTPLPTVDDEAVQRAVEEVAAAANHQEIEPRMQHFMTHDFGHETTFAVHRERAHGSHDSRNVYFTLSFAGVGLMAAVFVGVAVAKWRTARSPHAQGFIEVDQAAGVPVTPEEKHVVNMQVNGYENPTYKYFEVKE
ncbi:APLP2 family protein [Megaselia abdita]